jgi:hypothetical protein
MPQISCSRTNSAQVLSDGISNVFEAFVYVRERP